MSDQAINVPKKLKRVENRPARDGVYQRFLSWLSMSKPGLWRMRIDIMVMNYILLGGLALMAPVMLQPFAGPESGAYCGGDAVRGSCADNFTVYEPNSSFVYRWSNGFSVPDIEWTIFVFITASLILTIIWAFFVSRGTRLRGLVVQSTFPGFLAILMVLMPMVILPLLAGQTMFVVTHGGGLEALFTGVAEVTNNGRSFEVAFPGSNHYRSESNNRMFSDTLAMLFLFGVFAAFFVAISIKIILADGVMGLVKSIAIASIFAVITVFIGIIVFGGEPEDATFLQLSLLLGFGVLYYLTFRISLITNKRRKISRTAGLSFCMYSTGWFFLVAVFIIIGFDLESMDYNPWLWIAGFGLIYAIFLSSTFRAISRINLLPAP